MDLEDSPPAQYSANTQMGTNIKYVLYFIRFQYVLYVIVKYKNIFQYERYFRPESTVVASMFAPITFSPCPVLCYIQKLNKSLVRR